MSAPVVTVTRPHGDYGGYCVEVDGVPWCAVETPKTRGGTGRGAWVGPDWPAAKARAETIAAALRVALAAEVKS